MIKHNGKADNQIIWVAECDEIDPETLNRDCSYDPSGNALDVMDKWLTSGRPEQAIDSCFDPEGDTIYSGHDVWSGILDNKNKGACTKLFPIYPSARMIAGENIKGDTLKCNLKSADKALSDGDYGSVQFTTQQLKRLKQIFPDGVCAY